MMTNDTVCAPATASGGALCVVRVAGPEAIAVTDKVFTPRHGAPLGGRAGYTLVFGDVHRADGSLIDEVLVSVFRALERLEKGGYVQKSKDRKIYLTEQGRTFLEECEQAIFFLKEKMLQFAGIEEDTAEEEEMRIVCVLSDESRGKIVRAWQKREGKL